MTPHALALAAQRAYSEATHEAGGAQATLRVDGLATLAFRGTEKDLGDIITDMRALPWYSSKLGAWCHSGFLKSTRELYHWVRADAQKVIGNGQVLHVTGHSLGAAQATLFVCMMLADGLALPEHFTLTGFGSPRPQYGHGLNKWLRGVDVKLYRKGDDCVTRYPRIFASHVSVIRRLPSDGVAPTRFTDHRMAGYVEGLSRLG